VSFLGNLFGGGSGGTSSSSTSNAQTDDRIAASDDAVVVQLDSGAHLEFTDPQAWQALGLVVQTYDGILDTAIEFAGNESARSAGLVEKILDQNRPEDTQNFSTLLKWGAVIALGGMAFSALNR